MGRGCPVLATYSRCIENCRWNAGKKEGMEWKGRGRVKVKGGLGVCGSVRAFLFDGEQMKMEED
jgi:hypothetical protein